MRWQPFTHPAARLTSYSTIAAVSVGALYVVQSLLPLIAPDVGLSTAASGVLVAAVQIGYAAGLLVLVTRADDARMRWRSAAQLVVLTLAFAVASAQTTLVAIIAAFVVIGLVSGVGQSLMAVTHAQSLPGRSAHRVAVVTAAMIVGTFGGRVLAGALAEAAGWQGVLVVFAALSALSVPLLLWSVPRVKTGSRAGMAEQHRAGPVRATLALLLRDGRLRQLAVVQFFAFAALTAMWTVIAVHLTDPSIGWSIAKANWFGLVGLATGLVAPLLTTGPVARTVTRGRPRRFGFVALLLGTVLVVARPESVVLLVVSMFAVTLANQMIHAVNQDNAMTFALGDRAKANAAFMVVVFIGGAIGAAVGPLAYSTGGLRLTAAFAAAAGLLGVLATSPWLQRNTLRP
jgi:predicted MFS family arabinose efflux permease